MAEDYKTAQPREFYRQFLKENVRPDGRALLEPRTTALDTGSISTAAGSALARVGGTTIVAGVTAELAEPEAAAPDRGFIVPNIELSAVCSPDFRPGPPSEKSQVLAQYLADLLASSNVVDLTDLCITPGRLCWVLYVDLVVVSHDGNLLDTAVTVTMAALTNTTLPNVQINEETNLAEVDSASARTALVVRNTPVATTVALFDDAILLVDPSREEEEICKGSITVVVGNAGQLCGVYKPGGCAVKDGLLQDCILAAVVRSSDIRRQIIQAGDTVDR